MANCAIAMDGRTFCWGHTTGSFDLNHYIAPGDCKSVYYLWYEGRQCILPTPLATEVRFESLAGDKCGVTQSGEAYCWGDGHRGTLGDGRVGVYSVEPVRVQGGIRFQVLTDGAGYVCGLDLDGTAYCWGNNFAGQLGIGEDWESSGILAHALPTRVATDQRFVSIEAGTATTCALTAKDTVWCWGTTPTQAFGEASADASPGVPVRIKLPPS